MTRTRTAPRTDADKIADLVDAGLTEEQAARAVREQNARAADLATSTDPAVLLPAIRERLKLRATIERIVMTVSTPAHYRIETDGGTVQLGPSKAWATRPSEFAAAFLDSLGEMPAVPTGAKRLELNGMIARAAEPENIGAEATAEGWTRAMLQEYLDGHPPVEGLDEAADSQYPWRNEQGAVLFFGPAFTRWLFLSCQEKLTPTELGRRLRSVGCEPETPNLTVTGKRTTRACWQLPSVWVR